MQSWRWMIGVVMLTTALGCTEDHRGVSHVGDDVEDTAGLPDDTLAPTDTSPADTRPADTRDDVVLPDPLAELCEATGGLWGEMACDHSVCGEHNRDCAAPEPTCTCSTQEIFHESDGCIPAACEVIDDATLCEQSDGRWDETACGHYACGVPDACEAIIPGCDCGPTANFRDDFGCVADDACGEPQTDEALCLATDGVWSEEVCGHHICGEPDPCRAIIPGCDCGAGRNFSEGQGCIKDASCEGGSEDAALCAETGGTWDETSCGHYTCGVMPDCDFPSPGCDCGEGGTFIEGQGCAEDPECNAAPERQACLDSGGTWDESACGHYICGVPNTCEALIPGCDCGEGRTFDVEAQACLDDPSCEGDAEQSLCLDTGGRWDETACGHTTCGVNEQLCIVPDPGCNCGERGIFDATLGCLESRACFDDLETTCADSGGTWDTGSCGDYVCGVRPDCKALIPGCDCGNGQSFDLEAGCLEDTQCADPAFLCELTRGVWDETACGDDVCGVPNDCEAIIPGCDCGATSSFKDGLGCLTQLACGACPDPRDPDVLIISTDPTECARINFRCERGFTAYSNETCGCGCVPDL